MELMNLMEDWKGFVALSDINRGEGYEQKLKETIDLLSNAKGLPSHRHEYLLREALTTSDFPYLYADVVDRQMLAIYKPIEPTWKQYTRKGTVNRLHPLVGGRRFAIAGANNILKKVAEKGEYLATTKDLTKYDVYAYKYGAQFDISWESILADDLGALMNTPSEFAWAALNTEHSEVVDLYANDVNILGSHALGDLYDDSTAGEINANTRALTIANLEATVRDMMSFRDANGMPIRNRPKFLVVPPNLEFTARQILTSANKYQLATGDADTLQGPFPTANVIAQAGLQLIVEEWLPIMGLDGYTDNTWYLFANPTDIAAIEVDFLKGHERPEICMKASDKVTVGGGAINPLSGDFATDNIFYRVRECFGSNKLDWRATFINTVAD